jgi:predicted DNA-binding protein (MmcQ/YjbR family)
MLPSFCLPGSHVPVFISLFPVPCSSVYLFIRPTIQIHYFAAMELEILRNACLALKGTKEEIKWEHDLVYSIGGKMYCVTSMEGPHDFSCKVPDEQYEELILVPGIEPAPYLARARWVLVTSKCAWKTSKKLELVQDSYRIVGSKLTKKAQKELGLDV